MVTIKDVSKASGFSQATISRLFKDDKSLSITRETRQKIISTALDLGYERSRIKTIIDKVAILFLISEEEERKDDYFRQLHYTFLEYGEKNNLEVTFINERKDIHTIKEDVAGFIGVGSFTNEELADLKAICPIGVLLEINPRVDLFDTVKPDTNFCVKEAISLFYESNIKKIGFIGGKFWDVNKQQFKNDSRENEFILRMNELGILNERYLFAEGLFSVNQGYRLAEKMIQQLGVAGLPEGILVASDTLAIGVLQACNEYKIDIPHSLAVISINDDEFSKFTSPPLTTFHIEVEELAKNAIDLLSEQLVKPRQMTKTVLLTPELIRRKSF